VPPFPGCKAIDTIIAPFGAEAHVKWEIWPAPAGSLIGVALEEDEPECPHLPRARRILDALHLVLIFLNLLPHSKHFHVITAIPNVFFRDLEPAGRLRPMGADAEKVMEGLSAASRGQLRPIRREANRRLLMEGFARLLHVHGVRALLGQLSCAQDGEGAFAETPDARSQKPSVRARG
jgi:hypothetical protein